MTPATLRYSVALLPLLLPMAGGAEPLREIAAWSQAPESCERQELVQYLRHENVRVRSAALDLLELITGRDFGLDPWLPPAEVPEAVQKALAEWAAAEEMAGNPAVAPEAGQLAATVALLRTADPDTQRRICLRLAPWRAAFSAALQKALEATDLAEKERDNLRCALFRLQLQQAMPEEVGHVATLLTSHARNDMLEGLEALRKAGKEALPVLMQFADATDGLLREVAVDVLLQNGGTQAYKILMPRLMAESDRNILQIAARRAPDCKPVVPIIEFLNKCALSEDEDIAVAALEALADMEADDDEDDKTGSNVMAGAAQALPVKDFLRLMQSPHWRVRAAALRALQNKATFIASISDKELQAGIVHALQHDEDETVRAQAMQVLHQRKLVSAYLKELTEYAIRTPSATPYLVYLYCAQKAPLTPAMEDAIRRFSPDQVDMLVHYDDEYETVFDEDGMRRKTVQAVLTALLENPDSRVTRRVMSAWGANFFTGGKKYAEAFLAWLRDPMAPVTDKVEALRSLAFYRVSSKKRESESVVLLCDWLQAELATPTMQDAAMQSMVYAALLQLSPTRAEGLLDERVEKLEIAIINELLEAHPEYVFKMRREFVAELLQNKEFNSFSELLDVSSDKAPAMRELLASIRLPDDYRRRVLERELSNLRPDSTEAPPGELVKAAPTLMHAIQPDSPAELRAEAAFHLLGRFPDFPEARAVIDVVPEQYRSALQCLADAPRTAAEVLPWAEKYHQDSSAAVRRAVAGCLLPVAGWKFYMSGGDKKSAPFVALPYVAHRFPDAKRVSCPVELIRLVQALQLDEDPAVAIVACGSMLYRTGDCNRARLTALLPELQKMKADYMRSEGRENDYLYTMYRDICDQLEQVWYRWSEYRNGVEEFFKLKGSPKKLRPGLETLLAEFAAGTDEYPWSVTEDMKDKLPKRQYSSRASTEVQAHEFDFPAAPRGVELPVQATPPSASELVPEEDAEESEAASQPVAADSPVRVEFFRKDGCDVCGRVHKRLERLREAYPGLTVVEYDVESEAGRDRNTVLCSRFGVAPKDRRKAPTLFAESGVLLGDEADSERLDSLVKAAHAAGQRMQKLAASPQGENASPAVPEAPAPTTAPTAAPTPASAPAERLAESTAEESVAATGEQLRELVQSYGVLVIGGLVALLGALLLLFGRNKEE